jgi:Activator of Hsp90 ATPase homolog 1-like protein
MRPILSVLLLSLWISSPAAGEVIARSDQGFVIKRSALVSADAMQTWRMLLRPAAWWQSDHSWSGNAANLALDPRAGGCFCERIPQAKGAAGSAEHMRVIHAVPGRLLRMSGALGPLQGEAAQGTLTITLAAAEAGTQVTFEYVLGGYMRLQPAQIAPAVDGVLGAQLASLAAKLGGNRSAPAPAK